MNNFRVLLKYFGDKSSYNVNMSNYFVDMNNLSYVFDQETDLKTSSSKREYNKDVFTG
ncbi:MAG: hypothetical protein ACW99R_06760 [Candidatus Hodarchaeales archaeon]